MDINMQPVICNTCKRQNLSGGVRCIYCGIHFPAKLDFDMGSGDATPPATSNKSPRSRASNAQSTGTNQGRVAGWFASLGLLALKWKSILAVFKLGKIALTLGSMLVSIWFYAQFYQWPFAVGFVVCIFVHEMGHVFVNWRKGIPATAPMFIPFFGAVIFVKGFPDDPTAESECGAGGPIAGMLAAFVCLAIARATGNNMWLALAHAGFLINLFNLVPINPLDGSRIGAAFSPRIWTGVLFLLLLVALKIDTKTLWFIVVMGAVMRFGIGGAGGERYLLAEPKARLRMAAVYIGLCLTLSIGADHTFVERPLRPELRAHKQVPASSARKSPDTGERPADNSVNATATNGDDVASTSRPEPGAQQDVKVSRPRTALARTVGNSGGSSIAVALMVPILLWLLISSLLAWVTGIRYSIRHLSLAAAMMVVVLAILALVCVTHDRVTLLDGPGLLGERALALFGSRAYQAFMASTFGGLLYCVYAGYHNSRRKARPLLESAIAHCLAWATVGALLVGYTTNSLEVCIWIVALGGVYFAMNRWAWFSLWANIFESAGDRNRASGYLERLTAVASDPLMRALAAERALNMCVRDDIGEEILKRLTDFELFRGEAFARAETEPNRYDPLLLMGNPLAILEYKAMGYTLTEDYVNALATCERMLQNSPGQPVGPLHLFAARIKLGRIAYCRGWYDEALAQFNITLAMIADRVPHLKGRILAMRAGVYAEIGREAEALLDCDEASKLYHEPYGMALLKAIRAQVKLQSGDIEGAEGKIKVGLRYFPSNIYVQYIYYSVLKASGNEEGERMLRSLADLKHEYWGRRASEALNRADTAPV